MLYSTRSCCSDPRLMPAVLTQAEGRCRGARYTVASIRSRHRSFSRNGPLHYSSAGLAEEIAGPPPFSCLLSCATSSPPPLRPGAGAKKLFIPKPKKRLRTAKQSFHCLRPYSRLQLRISPVACVALPGGLPLFTGVPGWSSSALVV